MQSVSTKYGKGFRTTNIYGLVDPRDIDLVRYIGKANNVEERFNGHLKEYHKCETIKKINKKVNWFKSLKKQNLVPELVFIESVPMDNWQEMERHYIKLYKSFGARLVNSTEGGDGVGCVTEEQRKNYGLKLEKNHWYGKNIPQEAKEKISQTLKEYFSSEEGIEARKLISERRKSREPWNKGLKLVGDKYSKNGKNNLGMKRSEEVRLKLSEARRSRKIQIKQTEESKRKISLSKTGVRLNLSEEQRKKLSQRASGDNNPMSRVNIEKRKLKNI